MKKYILAVIIASSCPVYADSYDIIRNGKETGSIKPDNKHPGQYEIIEKGRVVGKLKPGNGKGAWDLFIRSWRKSR